MYKKRTSNYENLQYYLSNASHTLELARVKHSTKHAHNGRECHLCRVAGNTV